MNKPEFRILVNQCSQYKIEMMSGGHWQAVVIPTDTGRMRSLTEAVYWKDRLERENTWTVVDLAGAPAK